MAKKFTKVFRKHMKSIKKIPGPRFLYKDIKNLKKKYIIKNIQRKNSMQKYWQFEKSYSKITATKIFCSKQ